MKLELHRPWSEITAGYFDIVQTLQFVPRRFSGKLLSQLTLSRQSSWNRIFISTVHGVRNPIGSNAIADNFKTERFATGSDIPYSHKSVKLKKTLSSAVSQFIPRTLTTVFLCFRISLCDWIFSVWLLIFYSSMVNQPPLFLQTLASSIDFNSVWEFKFHFLRLKPLLAIIFFDLW